MSTFQYEIFIEVVESGSFTKTGEKLGLSQSGVSHNISTLEKELGLILLNRNRNGISLTDAGERMVPHIRTILFHSELLQQEATLMQGIQVGKIKIGSFPSFSEKILPTHLHAFQKMYPNIQFKLFEGGYEDIKNWVISGAVDIGFLTLPCQDLETIELVRDALVAIVPEQHRLSSIQKLSLSTIQNEPFIMPKDGCEALLKNKLKQAGIQPLTIFEVKDNHTILSMVKEELGMSIVPEMILPSHLDKVKVIPLETDVYRTIGLAMKSRKLASPAVKKFIEMMKEAL
ncbi:LysR family transcriptional regulator [Cytobacillus purgationiresistens]|uniref:DNA-binding transcriptional LysR family regulator n=1 Tax=Cytobacillus purgationiresistens TaxID=863449 RepID=A0ABU0AKS1_9BACI|nr:LysR family transcriptional regulator [Cytobacillus purgationiresistens]MDQ0271871.1 DNA-binding transcriptional LysR family regulator [Cytobacillus purgationiresistens]